MLDLGRAVSFYPGLVPILGSVNAVLVFCQLMYWTGRESSELGIHKTAEEFRAETGLTSDMQQTARTHLKKLGVLIETEKRLEHRIYYRLDLDRFNELFTAHPRMGNSRSGKPENPDSPKPENPIREPGKVRSVDKEQEITAEKTAENTHREKASAPLAIVKTYPVPDLDEISRQIVCAHPWALARHITPIRVAWTDQAAVIEAITTEAEAGDADPAAVAKLMLAKMQHLASTVPTDRWRWFANPSKFFRSGDYHLPPSRFVEAPQPVQETMSYADRNHQAEKERIRQLHRERAERNRGGAGVDLLPLADASRTRRG